MFQYKREIKKKMQQLETISKLDRLTIQQIFNEMFYK